MKDIFGGAGIAPSGENMRDDKMEILYRAMLSARPVFDDFEGHPNFPDRMLQADKKALEEKNDEIRGSVRVSSDDKDARDMEPVMAYVLGDERVLPTRRNFCFLASEYDDKCRGTDLVFGVEDKTTGKNMAFSVDVATGTHPDSIRKKFRSSFDSHDGVSYIKYCSYKDERWSEPDAPHFVLGMSPASKDRAAEKIIVQNGELKGREKDVDTDFIVLSEMKEQIEMEIAALRDRMEFEVVKQRVEKLKSLLAAVKTGLLRTLGINSKDYPDKDERAKVFWEKYSKKRGELLRFDDVYKNIMTEASRRKNLARGKDSMKVA